MLELIFKRLFARAAKHNQIQQQRGGKMKLHPLTKPSLPRLSLLSLALVGLVAPTQAADFTLGDFNLKADSRLTLGSSWRTNHRNSDYVAAGTLAKTGKTPGLTPLTQTYQGNSSSNTDNGNMNFDKWDAISTAITGNHDFSLSHNDYRNIGVKLGFRYWYDFALADLDGAPKNADMVNDYKNSKAFKDAKSDIELTDAYIWGEFDIADRPAQVLLGRHVLNWGESTFIQGGQNVANPVDATALRRPGAEVKDALLPVAMLSGSMALDEMGDFTLEAYYQLEWQRTRADACGTYFSNADFAAEGCGPVYYQSGETEKDNLDGMLSSTNPLAALYGAALGMSLDTTDFTIAARAKDNEPKTGGQFGVALKWYAENLNGTEFGVSFQNIHGRLPVVGGKVSTGSNAYLAGAFAGAALEGQAILPNTITLGGTIDSDLITNPFTKAFVQGYEQSITVTNPGDQDAAAAAAQAAAATAVLTANAMQGFGSDNPTQYIVEFPEDQKVIALSFASSLPTGTAWSGEFTYRPDAPVQINANDVLVRGLLGNMGYNAETDNDLAHPLYGALLARLPEDVRAMGSGVQKGYKELDIFQFQSTFIHDFNRILGADNLRVIGEVGFTYVNDLPDTDKIRFGRSSIYGSYGKQSATDDALLAGKKQATAATTFADNGYVTDFSWGYRLVGQLEYTNALIGGLTLTPRVSWSHDVSGYGPEPGSQFYEGRKILGTAIGAEYMSTYTAELSYTHYLNSGSDYWDLDDRDFISLSLGVNF